MLIIWQWNAESEPFSVNLVSNICLCSQFSCLCKVMFRLYMYCYSTFHLKGESWKQKKWKKIKISREKKNKISQNKCSHCIFLPPKRESSTPCYTLLEIVKLENTLKFNALVHKIHKIPRKKKRMTSCSLRFGLPVPEVHKYNTRYATNKTCTDHLLELTMVTMA